MPHIGHIRFMDLCAGIHDVKIMREEMLLKKSREKNSSAD